MKILSNLKLNKKGATIKLKPVTVVVKRKLKLWEGLYYKASFEGNSEVGDLSVGSILHPGFILPELSEALSNEPQRFTVIALTYYKPDLSGEFSYDIDTLLTKDDLVLNKDLLNVLISQTFDYDPCDTNVVKREVLLLPSGNVPMVDYLTQLINPKALAIEIAEDLAKVKPELVTPLTLEF